MTDPTSLHYEVPAPDGVPRQIAMRLPNGGAIVSSPVSSTLIHGERDAVLVTPTTPASTPLESSAR